MQDFTFYTGQADELDGLREAIEEAAVESEQVRNGSGRVVGITYRLSDEDAEFIRESARRLGELDADRQ